MTIEGKFRFPASVSNLYCLFASSIDRMMGRLLLGSPTNAGWFLPEPLFTISANISHSRSGSGELKNRRIRPPWFGSRIYTRNNIGTRTLRRTLKVVNSGGEGEDPDFGSSSDRRMDADDWISFAAASPYQILGVDPSCTQAQLKTAFRARIKEYHPDVCKDMSNSDAIIRRVIQAYEMLSQYYISEATERECLDPFEEPECEAFDLFVNEILCVGRGCPYSCVNRAPHAFSFTSENGTARATTQGHGGDYQVQLAVGQCPRRCIHYVTPFQRAILEELLYSVLNAPYDLAEAALLDSLIAKARFENNRYQPPKKQPKASSEYVDWY